MVVGQLELLILVGALLFAAPAAGGRSRNQRGKHDIELIEFIRNQSSAAKGNVHRDNVGNSRGGSLEHDTSKRVSIVREHAAVESHSSDDGDGGSDTAGTSEKAAGLLRRPASEKAALLPGSFKDLTEEELRHADLTTWKKKKKELRLALKASGQSKPLGPRGTTLKEFYELEAEWSKGGRLAKVPCSPPHCTFRCRTDAPCKIHPLVAEWKPPSPRICGGRKIFPISFGIPESEVVDCVPTKAADFATVVPYREKSYIFGPADEAEYKRDYRKAYFGITRKKEGWDCMRHYEILASGGVPMFIDINFAPEGVMTHLPKAMLRHVRQLPSFWVKGCDMKVWSDAVPRLERPLDWPTQILLSPFV